MARPVVKMDITVGSMAYKTFGFDVKSGEKSIGVKGFDMDEPLIIAGIANRAEEDRMREIVDPGGVDLRAFETNNVLLFQHNHSESIGTVTRMWAEEDGLHFEAKVGDPKKAPLTNRQKDVRSLIAQGVLKTVSIGFIAKEIQPPTFDDQGKVLEPMVIKKSELLELSVVAVPANAGAIFDMKSFSSQLRTFAELAKAVTVDVKGLDEFTEAQMDELKELLKAIDDRLKALGNDVKGIADGQESFQKQVMDKLDAPGADGKGKPKDDEEEEEEEEKALKNLSSKVDTLATTVDTLVNGIAKALEAKKD